MKLNVDGPSTAIKSLFTKLNGKEIIFFYNKLNKSINTSNTKWTYDDVKILHLQQPAALPAETMVSTSGMKAAEKVPEEFIPRLYSTNRINKVNT